MRPIHQLTLLVRSLKGSVKIRIDVMGRVAVMRRVALRRRVVVIVSCRTVLSTIR